MNASGEGQADSYVVILLPDLFLTYNADWGFSFPHVATLYHRDIRLSNMAKETVLELPIVSELNGEYQACGLLNRVGTDVLNLENWLDWQCLPFVIQP